MAKSSNNDNELSKKQMTDDDHDDAAEEVVMKKTKLLSKVHLNRRQRLLIYNTRLLQVSLPIMVQLAAKNHQLEHHPIGQRI